MKKGLFVFGLAFCFLVTSQAQARGREPCSGKKGGVAHCSGSKFICRDGTISASKKVCSAK